MRWSTQLIGTGMANLTIVTVTWNTWNTWTARLVDQVLYFINPDDYTQWIMIDNNSDDADHIDKAVAEFGPHREKFVLVRSPNNFRDLPVYDLAIRKLVETEKVLCLSTDMRIFKETLPFFSGALDQYAMVGNRGPYLLRSQADPELGGEWHWVPKLLEDRGMEFDDTKHIQTHAFGVQRSAYLAVGGFWLTEKTREGDKGDLIAGEMSLSIRLRAAGYQLGYAHAPMFHYGNVWGAQDEIDWRNGWEPFPRRFSQDVL